MSSENFKLLFVSSDLFPPFRVDVTVLFAKELASRGHQIDWILQSEDACTKPYRAEWSGGVVWVGKNELGGSLFNRFLKYLYSFLHDFRMFAAAKEGRHDAILVKDKFLAAIIAILACRRLGRKFIFWLSFPMPEAYLYTARIGTARYKSLNLIRGYTQRFLLYRIIMKWADFIFVQSEQMRRDIQAEGIAADKMQAVPMGVSLEDFPIATFPRAGRGTEVPDCSILYLGTMVKVRKLDFVIEVFGKLKQRVPQARLYMVGAGDDESDIRRLEDLSVKLGVRDSVVFTGNLPREEALNYVYHAAVCLSPFYPTPILNSTSPTKLVEYMSMGKPVVANDHPEQSQVIGESGAGFCVPWDVGAFAEAIERILCDKALAGAMGAAGREYVKSHRDYSRIADKVEQRLMTVCKRG